MKSLFIVYLFAFSVQAQSIEAEEIKHFKIVADHFWGVDTYENFYYSKGNVFLKHNNDQGTVNHQFKDFNLGSITSVDLINPLRIVLFYQDSNTVVLLDNRLNELDRFSFNEIRPLRTISHAKLAGNRHLWLFNVDSQRLEVFDYTDRETTSRSLPINTKINQLKTNFRKAWLVLSDSITIYDWYANQIKSISHSFDKIDISKNQIIGLSKDGHYYFKDKGKDFIKTRNLKLASDCFYLINQKLYIYRANKLTIYQLNQKP